MKRSQIKGFHRLGVSLFLFSCVGEVIPARLGPKTRSLFQRFVPKNQISFPVRRFSSNKGSFDWRSLVNKWGVMPVASQPVGTTGRPSSFGKMLAQPVQTGKNWLNKSVVTLPSGLTDSNEVLGNNVEVKIGSSSIPGWALLDIATFGEGAFEVEGLEITSDGDCVTLKNTNDGSTVTFSVVEVREHLGPNSPIASDRIKNSPFYSGFQKEDAWYNILKVDARSDILCSWSNIHIKGLANTVRWIDNFGLLQLAFQKELYDIFGNAQKTLDDDSILLNESASHSSPVTGFFVDKISQFRRVGFDVFLGHCNAFLRRTNEILPMVQHNSKSEHWVDFLKTGKIELEEMWEDLLVLANAGFSNTSEYLILVKKVHRLTEKILKYDRYLHKVFRDLEGDNGKRRLWELLTREVDVDNFEQFSGGVFDYVVPDSVDVGALDGFVNITLKEGNTPEVAEMFDAALKGKVGFLGILHFVKTFVDKDLAALSTDDSTNKEAQEIADQARNLVDLLNTLPKGSDWHKGGRLESLVVGMNNLLGRFAAYDRETALDRVE
ncbi:MAG: hypothetical protein WBQ73_03005 [Candidatus Babeliales bacterium]